MKLYKNLSGLVLIFVLSPSMEMHAQVQSSAGLKVVATGAIHLVFNDASLVNHGDFLPGNSTVIFTGSSLPAYIGGSVPVSFHDLVIIKPGHELQLNTNLNITGTLTMDQGNLQLNSQLLDLGFTGRINRERNESRITGLAGGLIRAIASLDAPRAANPGNIGVEITSTGHLGETIILRGHRSGLTSKGLPVIHRYYDIKPQHNTNLRASLKFYYLEAELNSNEGALTVFSGKGQQSLWLETGRDNLDAGNNWILKNDLDQLHRFTLAGATNRALAQQPGKTALQLFPNPAQDQFTMMLNVTEEKQAVVNLYDQSGRLMESKRVNCRTGINTIIWDIRKFSNGSYYVSFENLDLKMVKVVKQ